MDSDENEYLEKMGDFPNREPSKDQVNDSEETDRFKNKDPSQRPKDKSYRHDEDFDHQAKRSRKEDESDHHGNNRNSSLSNHSSSIERERNEREKRRRRRESKNRDREDSIRKEKDGDRIRERNRDSEKRNRDSIYGRDTEKEIKQKRSNRNHSDKYRDEGDRERSQEERITDTECKEREPVSEIVKNDSESRRTEEEKEEVPRADAERDQKTIFAYQAVMVKPSEAEKNLVQSTVASGAAGLTGCYSCGGRRLYVGNLHVSIKEDQLYEIFEPFGTIELVQLPLDPETGQRKGYGFVQFVRPDDARAALSLDRQLEISGQVMRVSALADHAIGQEVGASAGDFDNDDIGGLKIGCTELSTSAAAAPAVSPPSAPLEQTHIPAPTGFPAASLPIPTPLPLIYTIGNPSECLLLKNMFDPQVESEPDFDQDIKDYVECECTRFRDLKHIYVDRNSAGFVYLRFQHSKSAIDAQRALHGRWFDGKMITATYMAPQDYHAKFTESK